VLRITQAQPTDLPDIADLMDELDRFYGATRSEPLERRISQIEVMLFGDPPAAHVTLARYYTDLVGMAAYSFLWPAAGLTHSIFLKELYVRQAFKRQGIGRALVQRVCEIAVKRGCSRVEWQTETRNTDARQFYSALGVGTFDGKLFYRLEGDDVRRVSETLPGRVR
jgi:GNAT superfamily N-acetyltransferase